MASPSFAPTLHTGMNRSPASGAQIRRTDAKFAKDTEDAKLSKGRFF